MRVVFSTNPYKYQSETDDKTIAKHEIYLPFLSCGRFPQNN